MRYLIVALALLVAGPALCVDYYILLERPMAPSAAQEFADDLGALDGINSAAPMLPLSDADYDLRRASWQRMAVAFEAAVVAEETTSGNTRERYAILVATSFTRNRVADAMVAAKEDCIQGEEGYPSYQAILLDVTATGAALQRLGRLVSRMDDVLVIVQP